MRVLIVCEHASARFGGEAILPLHYFRRLRQRGVDARLIAHARTREELRALIPEELERIYFIEDTWLNKLAWRLGRHLPAQVSYFSLGFISRLSTQITARRLARTLVGAHQIDVVHQPIPVSPREPSLLFGLGAPVVIGPMNGNMAYPAAFSSAHKRFLQIWLAVGRSLSGLLHRLMPGKLHASVLLVANERTRLALPAGARGDILLLPENGVDLRLWHPATDESAGAACVRFVFIGRLVDWKAVDLLLEAFAELDDLPGLSLSIVGDGPERPVLQKLSAALGIQDRVQFSGWLDQSECAHVLRNSSVLVLPSLYECGGAVVLEAMACSIPVIATDWGGPRDYVDSTCGFLVPPTARDSFVRGLASSMRTLAADPSLRAEMGKSGRARAQRDFDWESKVDRILEIYTQAAGAKSMF